MTNTLEGFKLVPLVATEEMANAWCRLAWDRIERRMENDSDAPGPVEGARQNYKAMLSAYPDAPTEALREVVEAARSVLRAERDWFASKDEVFAGMTAIQKRQSAIKDLGEALSRLEAAVGGAVPEAKRREVFDSGVLPGAATHFVHYNGSSVFVKTADLFRAQGGPESDWGKSWVPVIEDSVEEARATGREIFNLAPTRAMKEE